VGGWRRNSWLLYLRPWGRSHVRFTVIYMMGANRHGLHCFEAQTMVEVLSYFSAAKLDQRELTRREGYTAWRAPGRYSRRQ